LSECVLGLWNISCNIYIICMCCKNTSVTITFPLTRVEFLIFQVLLSFDRETIIILWYKYTYNQIFSIFSYILSLRKKYLSISDKMVKKCPPYFPFHNQYFIQYFLMIGSERVESKKPMVGTSALTKGLANPAQTKKSTTTK